MIQLTPTCTTALEKKSPSHLDVTDIQYEVPDLVIYTENPQEFAKDDSLLGSLANALRKRVTI
ncbi:hypothetical protein [Natrinema versiforme]|uniref:hypothetical protein n=1 Tax=Natrinema versiforme TaxID=88724 RepID=UPI001EF9DDA7|nr:hypothetical protein [Natrinema versiforme]